MNEPFKFNSSEMYLNEQKIYCLFFKTHCKTLCMNIYEL